MDMNQTVYLNIIIDQLLLYIQHHDEYGINKTHSFAKMTTAVFSEMHACVTDLMNTQASLCVYDL